MKKRLMMVAFMVLALIFTAGCGSEKNEEAELETKSAGYQKKISHPSACDPSPST